ncbi:OmpA family protein [Rhodovulum steppense]|uniref:Outer membrane protein OmpA-like peptidoglycan-associated protein n=1 Tax=Rhodovulum steppense TaxID=540251 RepID=A0A4R1YTU0_9RHOB|nr:OmpA family protein [Rhodovulum steppense]TCM84468.1 outer membrane protein OmpA-like peptidoglycan-associated protein [Rhodovulum steppense]
MRATLAFLTLGAAVALSGCSTDSYRDFTQQAGASLDDGAFGNATMNNTMVQSGERAMAIDLNHRFASEVDTTITFAFDSAVLDAEARATLDRQAAWIARYPNVRFRVYGHTDLVGPVAYNKTLGMRRARATVDYLVTRGIARSRLDAVVSYGETQPLVVTEGRERRNRRTVTEVWGFLEPKRMLHDGKYMQRTYGIYVDSAQEEHTSE